VVVAKGRCRRDGTTGTEILKPGNSTSEAVGKMGEFPLKRKVVDRDHFESLLRKKSYHRGKQLLNAENRG